MVRLHEATGTSTKSWDAAVLDAVRQARADLDGEVVGFEVVRLAGDLGARSIDAYRATVRVAYRDPVSGP